MIDDTKINLQSDKWVSYPRAVEVLGILQDLLDHTTVIRPTNILLYGATNNGKSAILQRFASKNPRIISPLEDCVEIPVVYVQCDTSPDEKQLYASIQYSLNVPVKNYTSTSILKLQSIHTLKKIKCRLLIVDEIQHVLHSPPGKQRVFMDTLKYLSSELKISIVVGGTEESVRVLTSKQLANRFELVELPEWTHLNEEYASLFVSLMDCFTVNGKPFNYDHAFIERVHNSSKGNLGDTVRIIRRCCLLAYEQNTMELNLKLLSQIRFTDPEKVRSLG